MTHIWDSKHSNQKNFNHKVVDCIENYNFCIDHVNIRGYLKILKFESVNLKQYFRTIDSFK